MTRTNPEPDVPDYLGELQACTRMVLDEARSRPLKALQIARSAARSFLASGAIWPHARLLFLCAEQCHYLGRLQEMDRYVRQAEKVYPRLQRDHERGAYLTMLGTYHSIRGNIKEAYLTLRKAKTALRKIDDRQALGQIFGSLGNLFMQSGDLHTALDHYQQCLLAWEGLGDSFQMGVANCLINIGRLYRRMSHFDGAREYYERAITLHRSFDNHLGTALALAEIGALYLDRGEPNQAMAPLREALGILREMEMQRSSGYVLQSIAQAYLRLGIPDEALKNARLAIDSVVPDEPWNIELVAWLHLVIGTAQHDLGDDAAASESARLALEGSGQLTSESLSTAAHKLMADVLESQGNAADALIHFRRYAELNESIYGAERHRAFTEVEIRYKLAEAMKEQQDLQLRARLAENELEQKSRDLQSLALTMLHHNEAMKRLRDLVRTHSSELEESGGLQSILLETIDKGFEDHVEWRIFEAEFERVHRDFILRLQERCAELTPTELRICILIRLGLVNKQIADVLFISPVTVKTHRRNIRSKLGLAANANLTSMLLVL